MTHLRSQQSRGGGDKVENVKVKGYWGERQGLKKEHRENRLQNGQKDSAERGHRGRYGGTQMKPRGVQNLKGKGRFFKSGKTHESLAGDVSDGRRKGLVVTATKKPNK